MRAADLPDKLYELLTLAEKPARYIGREINMVIREPEGQKVRVCFCFPDLYEVGMSHLGLQIIYYLLNGMDGVFCERAFAPAADFEKILRDNRFPLFSLETFTPLGGFDMLGFTLQYEMSYTNILTMLDLAGIPFLAKDRGEGFPVLCAGGPCAYNPEPLAGIFDFFYIGEAENGLADIVALYDENRRKGGAKADFLEKLLDFDGVYVPKFYEPSYKPDGTLSAFTPGHPKARPRISKNLAVDFDKAFQPDKQLVPLVETVHNRAAVELFRGCSRGCRFCQAGFVHRPVRERGPETVFGRVKTLLAATGHEEVSLISLSTSDYSRFGELAEAMIDELSRDKVSISLPSLRIDSFNLGIMSRVQSVRKSSLTFAPEAGTQRMRDVINKNLSRDEILAGAKLAFMGGWDRIKLYFMVGLPSETDEDAEGIAWLCDDIVKKYYELEKETRKGSVSITASAACFVPKPFTPFQWAAQDGAADFSRKCRLVKNSITRKQVRFSYHEPELSVLEGVFARGDRRVLPALIKAYEKGARFDGWTESFKPEIWREAFAEAGVSTEFYTARKRDYNEILPWDFIDVGVSRDFLVSEAEKSLAGQVTTGCLEDCAGCGAARFGGGICVERA